MTQNTSTIIASETIASLAELLRNQARVDGVHSVYLRADVFRYEPVSIQVCECGDGGTIRYGVAATYAEALANCRASSFARP